MAVARRAGADAVHPGYGFLAENARFAEACGQAGLTFVGPPPAAIRAMGDKTSARKIARDLEVPMVPGTLEPIQSDDEARTLARQVGYPVMLKAAMGGGGKGMRLVRQESELTGALRAARSEAGAAFGDASVYLERASSSRATSRSRCWPTRTAPSCTWASANARSSGATRSSSRRSPSPIVDAASCARRMGEAACRIARAAGYVNAGTVEFLLDAERNFYFLEMNTRLQVEHPVTEMVTGHRPRARAAAHRGRRRRSATRRPT